MDIVSSSLSKEISEKKTCLHSDYRLSNPSTDPVRPMRQKRGGERENHPLLSRNRKFSLVRTVHVPSFPNLNILILRRMYRRGVEGVKEAGPRKPEGRSCETDYRYKDYLYI